MPIPEVSEKLEGILWDLKAEVRLDSFVEDVESLTTSIQYAYQPDNVLNSLLTRLQNEVFSEEYTQDVLNQTAALLHGQLAEIDDAAFVAMAIDSDLDSAALPQDAMALPTISVAGLSDEITTYLIETIQRRLATTAAGFASGMAAEHVVSGYFAYDEDGNPNPYAGLASGLFGFGVGILAEQFVSNSMDSGYDIRPALSDELDEIYSTLTSPQATWRESLRAISKRHEMAFIDSVIQAIGVDRTWALAQLP